MHCISNASHFSYSTKRIALFKIFTSFALRIVSYCAKVAKNCPFARSRTITRIRASRPPCSSVSFGACLPPNGDNSSVFQCPFSFTYWDYCTRDDPPFIRESVNLSACMYARGLIKWPYPRNKIGQKKKRWPQSIWFMVFYTVRVYAVQVRPG